jgi:hypothetical protein
MQKQKRGVGIAAMASLLKQGMDYDQYRSALLFGTLLLPIHSFFSHFEVMRHQ